LNFDENTVLCECIRSLSKKRLGKLVGQIDVDDLQEILRTNEYAYKNANKITRERRIYEWLE
jgi:mRNA-degrading endonuclease toxin of MazEF toxin-antitoxin module